MGKWCLQVSTFVLYRTFVNIILFKITFYQEPIFKRFTCIHFTEAIYTVRPILYKHITYIVSKQNNIPLGYGFRSDTDHITNTFEKGNPRKYILIMKSPWQR